MKITLFMLLLAGPALADEPQASDGYRAFEETARAPVARANLPAPVRATLDEMAGGRAISDTAQVSYADGHVAYEAEIHRRVRSHVQVEFSPSGELLREWRKPARVGTGP